MTQSTYTLEQRHQKYDVIYLIPHSHIDITWWRSVPECTTQINRILKSSIESLEGNPNLTYSIETVFPLIRFLDTFPEYTERIKKLLQTKRLEVSGQYISFVADLVFDELILQNILYPCTWLEEKFQYHPQIAIEEDVSSHTMQCPQILAAFNIPYLKISRATNGFYRWAAPNKDSVLLFISEYSWGYHSKLWQSQETFFANFPREIIRAVDYMKIRSNILGIPTGNDNFLLPLQEIGTSLIDWTLKNPQFPVKSGTYADVLNHLSPVFKNQIKNIQGDIGSFWAIIALFEQQIVHVLNKIKWLLPVVDTLASILYIYHQIGNVELKKLHAIWLSLIELYDHNWGGELPSTWATENDIYKLNKAQELHNQLFELLGILKEKFRAIMKWPDEFDTKPGLEPFVVFNTLSWERVDLICYPLQFTKGESVQDVAVFRYNENCLEEIPHQLEKVEYWEDRTLKSVELLFESTLPSIGYTLFCYQKLTQIPENPKNQAIQTENVLENDLYRIEVYEDGHGIKRILDKSRNREMIRAGSVVKPPSKMSIIRKRVLSQISKPFAKIGSAIGPKLLPLAMKFGWLLKKVITAIFFRFTTLGFAELWAMRFRVIPAPVASWDHQYDDVKQIAVPAFGFDINGDVLRQGTTKGSVQKGKDGPLVKSLVLSSEFLGSSITQEIFLYQNLKRIDLSTRVNWQGQDRTLLGVSFPLHLKKPIIHIEVPFGIHRLGDEPLGFGILPDVDVSLFLRGIQSWADFSERDYGITISSDWPVFDFTTGTPISLLMGSDDQTLFFKGSYYTQVGMYQYNYSLLPHSGNIKESENRFRAKEFLIKPVVILLEKLKNEPKSKPKSSAMGATSDHFSYVQITPDNLIISRIKVPERHMLTNIPADNCVIIRFYESIGKKTYGFIRFGFAINKVEKVKMDEVSLLESLSLEGDSVKIQISAWEIVTLRIYPRIQ